jgi:hypothetical protein
MASVQVDIEKVAKSVLGDRAWSVDVVLRMGAELAQAVNKFPSLSGEAKSELVCQTILKMLEDGEKAEKELMGVSTDSTNSRVPWEECKMVVKTLLPAILDLIVSAARGKFDLQKVRSVAVGCFQIASWGCILGLCAKATPVEKPKKLTLRNPLPTIQNQSNVVLELPKESAIQEVELTSHEPASSSSNVKSHDNAL